MSYMYSSYIDSLIQSVWMYIFLKFDDMKFAALFIFYKVD